MFFFISAASIVIDAAWLAVYYPAASEYAHSKQPHFTKAYSVAWIACIAHTVLKLLFLQMLYSIKNKAHEALTASRQPPTATYPSYGHDHGYISNTDPYAPYEFNAEDDDAHHEPQPQPQVAKSRPAQSR
eukprot:TRINITY_DN1926_c0_g1_i2.p1 TRINITY_DN1926_c0_g1~~TRINITY_DN1926_c0_g1_i2.p1  ORF type:complete len:130 (+),score=34.07 TRINITY_DN1926_c0_g1_i2:87-476(+)